MPTIGRIYPKDLDPHSRDDQNTLRIHQQRQEFAATNLSGQHILDMACGCGYGTALQASAIRSGRSPGSISTRPPSPTTGSTTACPTCAMSAPMPNASPPRSRSTASSAWKPSSTCPARSA